MRVLITSVSTGAGHVRAAEAIDAAFKEAHPDVEAAHVNIMDLVAKPFRRIYEDGYVFLADKAPAMWGWLYETTDKKGNLSGMQRAINAFQRNCATPFLNYLEQTKPDIVVTTHFLTSQIFSSGILFHSIPLESVITDYDLHRIWIDPSVRRYYVGDHWVADRFVRYGIDESRVMSSGIPIHPVFSKDTNHNETRAKLNLDSQLPTILMLSGGLGFGSLEQVLKRLFLLKNKLQIITVSGKNAEMKARLDALRVPAHIKSVHLGFVNNMHELLDVADLVVTKAGGLTTAECLAKGAPMVIYQAIPGQEEKNAHYVSFHDAGVRTKTMDELIHALTHLLNHPLEIQRLKRNARALGKPNAAFDIANSILNCFSFA